MSWVPVVGDAFVLAGGFVGVRPLPFVVFVTLGKGLRYVFVGTLHRRGDVSQSQSRIVAGRNNSVRFDVDYRPGGRLLRPVRRMWRHIRPSTAPSPWSRTGDREHENVCVEESVSSSSRVGARVRNAARGLRWRGAGA